MKNELYTKPTSEIFELALEGDLLTLSTQDNTINPATIDEWDEEL